MQTQFKKKEQLLLLGFIAFICILSASLVMAEGLIPKPKSKPVVKSVELVKSKTAVVPLPQRKPTSGIVLASNQDFKNDKHKKVRSKRVVEKADISLSGKTFPDKQARLYREVFLLQNVGDIKAADIKIKQITNNVLMGHVLAERYLHPTAYKTSFEELQDWMSKYADHPQAEQIHKLASLRKAKKTDTLRSPKQQNKIHGNLGAVSKRGKSYKSTTPRTQGQDEKVRAFKKDIRRHLKRNEPTMALNILNTDYTLKFLDNVERDRLKAEIASGYLFVNKLDQALKLSNMAFNRSGDKAPLAGWVKGLVQWQRGHYNTAAKAFESAARSSYSSGWMVSAAGYWASRAHMRNGNVGQVSKWLELASSYPRTFYGLIATRALGHKTQFDWSVPNLKREHVKSIEKTKHGIRAIALIKSGEVTLAESELRNIDYKSSPEKKEALLAYASHYKLPALSMQLGNAIKNNKGGLYDAALYPETSWTPKSGYKIDRALMHAIVRQESRFRTNAQNPSGATGLMQLMPTTANYVSGIDIYHEAAGQHQLKNPAINLELGQTYIKNLLNDRSVGQDLLSLAIAYNAGPGNLSKWKRERAHMKDPLLFIETIPFHETRAFVERVLSNYWIYRMRFNQDTPSLDAVAEGKWARYAAQDVYEQQLAAAK